MVFNNNTSQPSQTSLFQSPLYERSYEGHKVCVRFRYLIYGAGRHFLRIYQQLNLTDYPRTLMWAVNESNNIDMIWKYGRVALPSVTKHKVMKSKSPHNLFSLYILFSQWKSQGNLVHNTKQNLKESVPWSIITWPKLGKQNIQAKEDYCTDWFTFCSENKNSFCFLNWGHFKVNWSVSIHFFYSPSEQLNFSSNGKKTFIIHSKYWAVSDCRLQSPG